MNPNNANVRHLNGREVIVSLRDLILFYLAKIQKDNFDTVETEIDVNSKSPNHTPDDACSYENSDKIMSVSPQPNLPRRPGRFNNDRYDRSHDLLTDTALYVTSERL